MSANTFEPWNYEAVLRAFGELTGIRLKRVPYAVQQQAVVFAETFTLRDLELVILYTRRQIARNEGGLSPASLQWHVLMGKPFEHSAQDAGDFMAFQNRLGLAEEAMKRTKWQPPFRLSAPAAPEPRQPAAMSEYDRIRLASQRRADEKLGGARP
jgi:hypothetical protein